MPKAFVLKINGRLTEEGRQFLALLNSPDVEGVTIDDFTALRAEGAVTNGNHTNTPGPVLADGFDPDDEGPDDAWFE